MIVLKGPSVVQELSYSKACSHNNIYTIKKETELDNGVLGHLVWWATAALFKSKHIVDV